MEGVALLAALAWDIVIATLVLLATVSFLAWIWVSLPRLKRPNTSDTDNVHVERPRDTEPPAPLNPSATAAQIARALATSRHSRTDVELEGIRLVGDVADVVDLKRRVARHESERRAQES